NALLDSLVRTSAGQKDYEADELVRRAVARQPDAAYLLVQRTLLQDVALKNAQSRIAALEQQLRQAQPPTDSRRSGGSFLDGGWGQQAPAGGSQVPQQGWNVQQPVSPSVPQPSAFSGFLRSAATTAAGVAGGALLFQGLEDLFGHHGGWSGQPQEIVENINNEYIEPPQDQFPPNNYADAPQDQFLPNDSDQFIQDNSFQPDWGGDQGFDNSDNFYQS
ncbi:MAG: DUF2076 domain-containing protein, partial [Chroococcidiopsidaceae cyanobacterium CP_BM_ER_R8_30]|nr:DUF2076 domain-containing protein [Chroococcidiopsidaceae cyanobacterium CP_BM_ER_R8_30]